MAHPRKKMFVKDLFNLYGKELGLKSVGGEEGFDKRIALQEPAAPGLCMSGYAIEKVKKQLLVFGAVEIEYLMGLSSLLRKKRLFDLLIQEIPAVIVSCHLEPPMEMVTLCKSLSIPLFTTKTKTTHLFLKLVQFLSDEPALFKTVHGTLVEVFGIGVLIQGDSSTGKSEAALGLISKGHRLVSDDLVRLKKDQKGRIEGEGASLNPYHMEIRGIGIINVASLYGVASTLSSKSIDLVVELALWDEGAFYDRVGLEDRYCTLLEEEVAYHFLPVKPGRDVPLLLETIALNHRLKQTGVHSAKEFNHRLHAVLSEKPSKGRSFFEAYANCYSEEPNGTAH